MKKNLSFVSTILMLGFGLSSPAANAGMIGTASVNYDFSDAKTIYTLKSGSHSALEFDINVTLPELDLKDFDAFGYCVEIDQSISAGNYEFNFASLSEMNNDAYYRVAWLVDTYAPRVDFETTADDSSMNNQAAALQGLVWNLLGGNNYKVTNEGVIGDLYKEYRNAVQSLSLTDSLKSSLESHYMIMKNSSKQDLIVWLPSTSTSNEAEVREPTTLILIGAGLVGLRISTKRISRGRRDSNIL